MQIAFSMLPQETEDEQPSVAFAKVPLDEDP